MNTHKSTSFSINALFIEAIDEKTERYDFCVASVDGKHMMAASSALTFLPLARGRTDAA